MEVAMKPRVRRPPISIGTPGGAAAFLAAAGLIALVAWPAAVADDSPVFPTQVELVTIDALVVDESGVPVPNLAREDFTVLEDGVRQEIATFEAISLGEPPEVTSAASPRAVRVATNVASPAQRTTFLVVVDDIHLSAATIKDARTTLERFLVESVRDGDRVTIVSTGTRAAWSGSLPDDRSDLLEFVGRLKGRLVKALPGLMTEYEAMRIAEYNDTEALERVMGRYYRYSECSTVSPCDAKVQGEARAVHGQAKSERESSLLTVESALEGLAQLRGHKAVVLLSEGFIHDDPQERSYSRVVGAAQRTNAAVYFVDVRGVVGLDASASAAAPEGGEPTNPKLPSMAVSALRNRSINAAETLARARNERLKREVKIGVETVADDTGGFIVRGTNDLASGLQRISLESRSYYLLGYYPTNTKRDGTFRKIEVQLSRRGLRVRARNGYEAPLPEGKTRRARRASERDPLAQAFEAAADVPLRLATYSLEPAAQGKTRVLAVTEIDVSGLRTEEKAGRRVAHLDFRLEAIPRDGGETRVHSVSMDADLPAVGAAAPVAGVWRPIRLEFELPSGVYRVRARARDTSSGKVGIVGQRLVVDDAAAFRISTPILSDVVVSAGGASPARDPVPLARQQFVADAGRPLLCQFEVFGAARRPVTQRADVTVQLTLTNEQGRAVGAAAPVPMTQSGDGRLRQLIALPLDRMAAGRYALTLVVEDRVAGAKDEWQDTFVIEAPPTPAGQSALAPAGAARMTAAAQIP
jgi:VWFA-related protein